MRSVPEIRGTPVELDVLGGARAYDELGGVVDGSAGAFDGLGVPFADRFPAPGATD